MRPLTDRPDERFIPGAAFSTDEAEPRLLHIESSAEHSDGLIVSFAGIDDRDEAAALRGVSLDIEAGDFVSVFGTSGSGKSTLLYLLGMLMEPTRGSYRFDDR